MTMEFSERTMLVGLPEHMVVAILQMNACLKAGLAESLQDLIAGSTNKFIRPHHGHDPLQTGKYSAEFLGIRVNSQTVSGIFAKIVNLTAEVAPEALDKLAAM